MALVASGLTGGGLISEQASAAGLRSSERIEEGFGIGQRPPQFSAIDLNGKRQTLKQYRGRIVVLHFWATWCPYCRGEIPKLFQIHEQGSSLGVTVLAVSVDHDLDQLQTFVQQVGIPYIVIPDAISQYSLAIAYGIRGFPVTYLLDRTGRIAYRFFGSTDLIGAVQHLLDQSSAPKT